MKVLLDLKGKSQYASEVDARYQKSACGPTTINVILNYLYKNQDISQKSINELYKLLGTTKIGLFKWRLVRNLQQLLGKDWIVEECTVNVAMDELRAGRPVAMKFDKYFSFNWFSKPVYKYHWVPLVGYEIRAGKLYLKIHDNGGRNRESKVIEVLYEENRDVLSFVKIAPKLF